MSLSAEGVLACFVYVSNFKFQIVIIWLIYVLASGIACAKHPPRTWSTTEMRQELERNNGACIISLACRLKGGFDLSRGCRHVHSGAIPRLMQALHCLCHTFH